MSSLQVPAAAYQRDNAWLLYYPELSCYVAFRSTLKTRVTLVNPLNCMSGLFMNLLLYHDKQVLSRW